MNVYVIRNAEVYSNANMIRIIEALHSKHNITIISRSRDLQAKSSRKFYNKKLFQLNNNTFDNYEIGIISQMGKGLKNLFRLIRFELLLFRILFIKRKEIDIIHAFDLDCGLVSIIFSKLFRKKVVYHIADFYVDSRPGIPKWLKFIIRRMEYYVIKKAKSVIICSEQRIKQISGSKPKKLSIVHNVPISNLDLTYSNIEIPINAMKSKKISIGYVGGLTGVRFTKEILNIVKNQEDVFLNIAGFGDLASYTKDFSGHCLNIKYYGRVDYNSAMSIYNYSDLILIIYDPSIPNHKYSAPNKIYEAMMLGKAIIAVIGTGVDEIVRSEKMGLVIDFSEEALSNAINYLKNNLDELEVMKKNAQRAYNKYSWEEMKNRIILIYEELLSTKEF